MNRGHGGMRSTAGTDTGPPDELAPAYHRYFRHSIASSSQEAATAFHLRYRVYDQETGWLVGDAASKTERDACDDHAAQCLLYHRPSDQAVGTARLILPVVDEPFCALPARRLAPALDELSEDVLPRSTTAEISRFTIIPEFRRRSGDGLYGAGRDLRRSFPYMMLGLMMAMLEAGVAHRMTHICAIIDPALIRLLCSLGIRFNAVGVPVDFHGPRQPAYFEIATMAASMAASHPHIHAIINAGGLFDRIGRSTGAGNARDFSRLS